MPPVINTKLRSICFLSTRCGYQWHRDEHFGSLALRKPLCMAKRGQCDDSEQVDEESRSEHFDFITEQSLAHDPRKYLEERCPFGDNRMLHNMARYNRYIVPFLQDAMIKLCRKWVLSNDTFKMFKNFNCEIVFGLNSVLAYIDNR